MIFQVYIMYINRTKVSQHLGHIFTICLLEYWTICQQDRTTAHSAQALLCHQNQVYKCFYSQCYFRFCSCTIKSVPYSFRRHLILQGIPQATSHMTHLSRVNIVSKVSSKIT